VTGLAPAEIHLPAGQFFFGRGQVRVQTVLGTCVAIALWHPIKRIGGICHYLLPTRSSSRAADSAPPGMYADEVMELFADALRGANTLPQEYVVKIAGGGHMFPEQLANTDCREGGCTSARRAGCQSVGCQNICAARMLLVGAGYAIASEHVGGHGSRRVIFDLWSGDVWVKRGAARAAGQPIRSLPWRA
jgi:chemotaxis protein CheD